MYLGVRHMTWKDLHRSLSLWYVSYLSLSLNHQIFMSRLDAFYPIHFIFGCFILLNVCGVCLEWWWPECKHAFWEVLFATFNGSYSSKIFLKCRQLRSFSSERGLEFLNLGMDFWSTKPWRTLAFLTCFSRYETAKSMGKILFLNPWTCHSNRLVP